MLYIAFVNRREDIDTATVRSLSEEWWNGGKRPEGLTSRGIFGAIGTDADDVFVFDCDDHRHLQTMVDHWRAVADLSI
ncbi:MAG: hypothetical protein AAGK32_18055, partial [Actinomycetota bacterium]